MNLRSRKFIFLAVFLCVFLLAKPALTQDEVTIDASITKYSDFYRFTFKGKQYVPFDVLVDGNDVILDFEDPNNLDLSKYIYKTSIVKSFGASADAKSYIIKLKASSVKLRKFIGDNNTTGFDLFTGNEKNTRKTILMSSLPENVAVTQEVADSMVAEADIPKEGEGVDDRFQVITYPLDFIGPPRIEQLMKDNIEFVGPPQYDPRKYAIYEVMKVVEKGIVLPDITIDDKSLVLSFSLTDIDSASAAAIVRKDKIDIIFNTVNNIQLNEIVQNPFFKQIRKVPDEKYRIIEIDLNPKKVTQGYQKAFYKNKQSWVLEIYNEDDKSKRFEVNQLALSAENNFGEKRIVADATEIVGPAYLTDEATGDRIVAFMVKDNATGVVLPREFIDLKFMQSLQGVFIKEKSDYLNYDLKDDKLTITKLSNLQISDEILSSGAATPNIKKSTSLNTKMTNGVFPEKSIFPFEEGKPKKIVKKVEEIPVETKKEEKKHEEKKPEEKKEKKKSKHSWLNGIFVNDAFAADSEDGDRKKDEPKVQGDVIKAVGNKDSAAPDLDSADQEYDYSNNMVDDSDDVDSGADKKDITTMVEYYLDLINRSKTEKRSQLKLELANLYFRHKLYSESLGMLQDVKQSDPNFKNMFAVDSLTGVNQYMIGKYDDAVDTFTILAEANDKNPNYNELRLWQWASMHQFNLKRRNVDVTPLDINFVSSYDKFMQDYPVKLKYDMALMYIDERLKASKIEDAKGVLELITYGGVPKSRLNDTKFYAAYIASKMHNEKAANKLYGELLKDAGDRKNRARAMVETTRVKLLKGEITQDQAIDSFLQASTVWRDDYFDMDVLEIVGNLYMDKKDYASALATWKEIANDFPETTESLFILGKMKQLFTELFDVGVAYKMKPLDTLKLYFGFRELTPAGEEGDRITRKMAKFFISTDMTDEATKIIEHQIKFRSTGDDKAKLAIWLSDINIDNHELDRAESALNYIRENEVSPVYAAQKNYQLAYITALRGDYDKAMNLIKGDFSKPAQKVRTELFWQKQNWFGVMNTVESRLDDIRETKPLPLSRVEMNDINRLMVAYAAQNENNKLELIRNEFESRLNPSDELLFNYVTEGTKKIDYNNFDETVELGKIEKFVNDYSFMPDKDWASSIKVLQPQVKNLVGKPAEEVSREDKVNVIKLAIAYSMITPKDEKEANEFKKDLNNLARDFKDLRIDRFTIDAFTSFDDKLMPKENDAVFEGKIKITDIPQFIPFYQATTKFSDLNMAIRSKFN